VGQSTKFNVLLIVVDDLSDHLGCYGDTIVKTPNIDRLAARGVVLTHAYSQFPGCNPSRSSFLTGLRPDQIGITDNATLLRAKHPRLVTLPQCFKQNGYYTASFGKVFHLNVGRSEAARRRWLDLPYSWHESQVFGKTAAAHTIEGRTLAEEDEFSCSWGATAGRDDDQPDGQAAQAAISLIHRQTEQPWFIGVGFYKPHDPLLAPRKYFDLYPLDELPIHRDPSDLSPAPNMAIGFGALGRAYAKFTDAERREFLRGYYACVSFADAQVGRLLDTLDQQQLWDRTIVVLTSDHGFHLGERGWWNKNTLFERSCRVPLIVAAPGIEPGRAAGVTELIDLYPTLIKLCGLESPHNMAGSSFLRLLKEHDHPGKRAAHTMVLRGPKHRGDSIRTLRWRYTEWFDGERELYDHDRDPGECHNLAAQPAYEPTMAELQQLLKNIRASARSVVDAEPNSTE
jgi:uncharacterized sulfatase